MFFVCFCSSSFFLTPGKFELGMKPSFKKFSFHKLACLFLHSPFTSKSLQIWTFFYPPSSGIASSVGTMGMVMCHLHLMRPCCVALGRILIWGLYTEHNKMTLSGEGLRSGHFQGCQIRVAQIYALKVGPNLNY